LKAEKSDASGTMMNGLVHILDTNGITHQCANYTRTGNRATNYRGMFNARLHFLKAGDQFDLKVQSTTINDNKNDQPIEFFDLYQNYPNPFNASTMIQFSFIHAAEVNIRIINLRGEIVNEISCGIYSAGFYQVSWDGTNDYGKSAVSGIYYCRLDSGNFNSTRKMILLR